MCEIIPGILEKQWGLIEAKLELVKPFAKTVHIDILDNKFVPNSTFLDPTPFKKYKDVFLLELHMMVEEPIQYLKPFAESGFKRFLGHIEKMSDQEEFVAQGQLLGEVGLAIDGETSLEKVTVDFDDLDAFLIMSIKAGFSGQSFVSEYAKKIAHVREKYLLLPIEVDGGINNTSIQDAKKLGANRFVTTSFLFNSEDPLVQYRNLESVCNSH